ncbi:unnamed protein product, partial [Adineta steineri]
MKLSPQAAWNQTGFTVTGNPNGISGSSISELNYPVGISIADNDILYISDALNHRIIVIYLDSTIEPFTIGSRQSYYYDAGNKRVQKMSLNGSYPTTVSYVTGLQSSMNFYIDNVGNIYVSDVGNHSVFIFRLNLTNGLRVAGNGINGSTDEQLNAPYGIFVNDIETIYIADCYNHRIMKWLSNEPFGIRVAGDGTPGSLSTQVYFPTNVIVDENEYMYITESGSARVTRWAPNSTFGVCIVACTRTCGAAPSQISAPHSLAFDSFGSLYVGEWGNHRVQKFELLNYPISYNQPKLCPNVNWSEHGITFVNSSTLSSSALGIFIDLNDTIYVSDYSINKILIWSNQSISLQQKSVVSLYQYTSLFVTLNGDIYFENGNKTGRVEKFTSNSIKSEFVANFSGNCRGLFVDIQNSLYCSINSEHRVAKVLLDNDHHTITIVAGTNSSGSKSYQLNGPWGIFIDINFNLYVADAHNNRIQFFRRGELNGTTVAGNKTPNNLVLEHPTDVILDGDGFLYVADNDHHRIIQVRKDEYQCISSCKMKSGLASNQLNKPYSLRFDSFGNLYVTDEFNHRIQKFDILNNSCEIISTTAALTTEIPTTILLTTELPTTHACKTPQHSYLLPSYFVAPSCEDSTNIGFYCDILGTLCDIQNQCVNNGKCININDNQDYNCSCSLDFSGKQCQFDQRVCKENTCLNKGELIFSSLKNERIFSIFSARVTRWAPNSTFGVCIVACTRTCGAAPSQISAPHSLAFDSFGSLYVGEWGNHRVQKFELLNYPISYNQPKLCPNVNWSEHGITFVNASTLFSSALGIFIDLNDTIYASDFSINKILIWSNQSINFQQKSIDGLYLYTSLFVTLNGDIYFDNGNRTGRIEKFTSNSTKSKFVANFSGNCFGLFVDIRNSLYCSIYSEHRVEKVLLDNDHHTITIVAGTDSAGSELYQLNGTWGIFVDVNFNLYVADAHNNRIQSFRRGELNGTTVAGNDIPNNLTLNHPTDVILDGDGFLYVVDNDHYRIIQVRKDEYQCISGCEKEKGSASNQFDKPYSLRFDSFGNLYVTDEFNHRIQRFDILNNSCEIISTTALLTTALPTTTLVTCEVPATASLTTGLPAAALITTELPTTTLLTTESPATTLLTAKLPAAALLTTELPTTRASETPQHSYLSPPYFVAPSCEDSTNIGFNCNIPGTICDIQNQCLNNGKCININDNQDYNCSCPFDFSGKQCQFDQRVCKENTCLNK